MDNAHTSIWMYNASISCSVVDKVLDSKAPTFMLVDTFLKLVTHWAACSTETKWHNLSLWGCSPKGSTAVVLLKPLGDSCCSSNWEPWLNLSLLFTPSKNLLIILSCISPGREFSALKIFEISNNMIYWGKRNAWYKQYIGQSSAVVIYAHDSHVLFSKSKLSDIRKKKATKGLGFSKLGKILRVKKYFMLV